MNEEYKNYLYIVIGLLIFWGIIGFISGYGFFGGIRVSIWAIGELIIYILKCIFVIFIIWLMLLFFKIITKS